MVLVVVEGTIGLLSGKCVLFSRELVAHVIFIFPN